MDRIRKALDLAREERVRPLDSAVDVPRALEPRSPEVLRPHDPKGASLPTSIEYTKTKTFAPPAELLESNRIIDGSGTSAAAGAFRMLRTQVLQRMEEHSWRSLAVLSPGSEDGKTTTAINLAVTLANDHRHTVLLVDFDLRRPTIAEKLG